MSEHFLIYTALAALLILACFILASALWDAYKRRKNDE